MLQGSEQNIVFGVIVLVAIIVVRWIFDIASLRVSYQKVIRQYGCKPTIRYPHKDPLFGLDDVWESLNAAKAKRFLARIRRQYERLGNTYSARFLTYPVINTIEPENIKAVLSSRFSDYGVGSRRREAFKPLLGKSIILLDGQPWKHSRARLRPIFARDQVADLERLEYHVKHLIEKIPTDGSTVDLATLFFRLTPDISTEFIFGESINSLVDSESQDARFAQAFKKAQAGSEHRWRLGSLARLIPQPQFFRDVAYVHQYIEDHVVKAPESNRSLNKNGPELRKTSQADKGRYIFLDQLLKYTSDKDVLRDEILSIFLAGRDTTASLLCNCFFVLSRRPDIWAELRKEVEMLKSRPPTLHQLSELSTIQNCLKECMYRSMLISDDSVR